MYVFFVFVYLISDRRQTLMNTTKINKPCKTFKIHSSSYRFSVRKNSFLNIGAVIIQFNITFGVKLVNFNEFSLKCELHWGPSFKYIANWKKKYLKCAIHAILMLLNLIYEYRTFLHEKKYNFFTIYYYLLLTINIILWITMISLVTPQHL